MQQTINPSMSTTAHREKRIVALTSVLAAVLLTGIKLVVGIWTGSLGILSEAAHSALDLVAAVVTFFAVRASARPADSKHTYGHGKVENLSALFETLLLLATCVWIIIEAFERLFYKSVAVEINGWAFGVILVSIAVDLSRSRALARVAKKYDSQALEADALHFSTDIWSSCVVLFGLAIMWFAERAQWTWLAHADALAALGVAVIVIWVSYRLGRKTVADLLDEVAPGLRDEVLRAVQVPGVQSVTRVRVRRSGPDAFVDVTLCVDASTTLEEGHAIADRAENAVRQRMPQSDVVVHVEPIPCGSTAPSVQNVHALVRQMAKQKSLAAHDIQLRDVMGENLLELHLEVDATLDVATAHTQATEFESSLREQIPFLGKIITHIEPVSSISSLGQEVPAMEKQVREVLRQTLVARADTCHPHDILVHEKEGELCLSFHCTMDSATNIADAHDLTQYLEHALFARIPELSRVVIHVEPPESDPPVD